MPENIGFSVVIAAKGRVALLRDLLHSLEIARQAYPGKIEVLLMDDSEPNDQERIIDLCRQYDAQYYYFPGTVAAKRNHGADRAEHEILHFLDSDCLVKSDLYHIYKRAYQEKATQSAAGPLEFVGKDTWFWKAIAVTPFVVGFYLPRWLDTVEWGVTANFTVRRWLFHEIGGFDVTAFRSAGEDVDLGLRIRKAGYEIISCKEALVLHSKATWTPFRNMTRRVWNYGAADYGLVEKHPERAVTVLLRRLLLYGIWLVLILVVFVRSASPWIIGLFPLLILLENGMLSMRINATNPYKKASFSQQMVAQLLIHINEAAYLFKCLKKADFKRMNQQMVYYQGQYKGMLEIGAATFWISLFLTAGIGILVGIYW